MCWLEPQARTYLQSNRIPGVAFSEAREGSSEWPNWTCVNGVTGAIFRVSVADDRILDANLELAKLLGYRSVDELFSASSGYAASFWEDPQEFSRQKKLIGESGCSEPTDCRLVRKDGTTVLASLKARLHREQQSGSSSVESHIYEIAQAEQTRPAASVSEAAFERLFEDSATVMLLIEPSNGKIAKANRAASTFYGHPIEHLAEMFLHDLSALDSNERFRLPHYPHLEGETCCTSRHQCASGQRSDVELLFSTFEFHGRNLLLAIVNDVTEGKLAEAIARSGDESLCTMLDQAEVGILCASFDGRILECNATFAKLLGYTQQAVSTLTLQSIIHPEDLAKCGRDHSAAWNAEDLVGTMELRLICSDHKTTWTKATTSLQHDKEGRPLHIITLLDDINAQKMAQFNLREAQDSLRNSETLYRTAVHTSLDAVNINRLSDGTYLECNDAFLKIMGYRRDEVIGRTSLELNIWANPADRANLANLLQAQSQCKDLEVQLRHRCGRVVWGLMSASLVQMDGDSCIISVTRDISDAKAAASQIQTLSFYDPLTLLPNRRLLLDRLQQALVGSARDGGNRALLLVDLDYFKTLNETLGHQTGDHLLQQVASRIRDCLRDSDTVGRLGGDEFVVMLDDLSDTPDGAAAQASVVADKILAAMDRPFHLHTHEWRCTCSIGIALFGDVRKSKDEVLQQADMAMFQAKASGRNTHRFFTPAIQAAVHARVALEDELRKAIRANEFLIYYQPQVEHGIVTGAEALIRWQHPTRGILSPSEFISVAEETSLILPLGNWALENVCNQLAKWARRKDIAPITVAVNISAKQFRHVDFVGQVLMTLDRTGASPRQLKLELTESMLVEDIEDVIEKMTELKHHGVRFPLDDFGTGYSSLSYLKRLPLDQLKIDRSFVRDILVDAGSGAIARTIISLSRAMGLSVIAEGVETEEQKEFLGELACDSFQGYLFSKPLPLSDFEILMPLSGDKPSESSFSHNSL